MCPAVVSPAKHLYLYGNTHNAIPYDGIAIPVSGLYLSRFSTLIFQVMVRILLDRWVVVRSDHIGSAVGGAWIILPKDALYYAALGALLIEHLGRLASVRLAAVDRATLFDIGGNPHLEEYLAVVV